MKKRIFALLLAMLMVFSVLAFAGCEKNNADDEEEGDVSLVPLTTKELFGASVINTVSSGSYDTLKALANIGDFKGTLGLKINELSMNGQSLVDGKISANASIAVDLDGKAIEVKADAEFMGEKPTAALILNTNGIYAVDVLGINDKPIAITWEDMGINVDEVLGGVEDVQAEMEKYTKFVESAMDIVVKAIDKNFPEEKFVTETKAVTVNGKDFENATVIKLEITGEMVKALLDDVLTELAKDETFIELSGGEFDKDEILADFELNATITIENTIVDNTTIALDVDVKGEQEVYDYDTDEEGVEAFTFAARCHFVNGANITAGFINESGQWIEEKGVIEYDYVINGSDATMEFTVIDDGEEMTLFTFNGTLNGNTLKGTFNMDADGMNLSIDAEIEDNGTSGKIAISNIKMSQQGQTMEIPVQFSVKYEMGKTKVAYEIAIKLDFQGVKIDASASISCEYSEVSIKAPSNAMSVTDLDQDTVMGWLEELEDKFPNIMGFVEDMYTTAEPDVNTDMPDEDDYYYEDEYEYTYGY